jgi:hypothetical protein
VDFCGKNAKWQVTGSKSGEKNAILALKWPY